MYATVISHITQCCINVSVPFMLGNVNKYFDVVAAAVAMGKPETNTWLGLRYTSWHGYVNGPN